jgi:hypothetical protein
MTDMAKHSVAAKGGSLRRAWISAWIVTVTMGGTTMAFQVYHSITRGHMPASLAVLYGIVPLLIAILVLEIVAEWAAASRAAKLAAYAIMGAAMFLSASATGAVVQRAAPPHFSLLPGALLDGAELLAAFFIMNGKPAADAAAGRAAEEAQRRAQEAAKADDRAARDAAITAREAELQADAENERAARRAAESTVESLRGELALARDELGRAVARAEKLAGNGGRKRTGSTGRNEARKPAGTTSRKQETATAAETLPDDVADIAEARVRHYLEKGHSASEAGRLAGVSDSRGRQIARDLAKKSAEAADTGTG